MGEHYEDWLNETITRLDTENAQLKRVIVSLRKQLEKYQRKSRRDYEINKDYIPYQEDRDER